MNNQKSQKSYPPDTHRFAHEAMATTFEILIAEPDRHYAQQAAWAAFCQLDQLESELSRFVENSDIARINHLPAETPITVGPAAFECLSLAVRLFDETSGAFDITVKRLIDCWLNADKTIRRPLRKKIEQARCQTGMQHITLDDYHHSIKKHIAGLQIDLGGIGKGYALDKMAQLLKEWSIKSALLHGGASTALALRPAAKTRGWHLTISSPSDRTQTLAHLSLHHTALSGSGVEKGPHIIDPRNAGPVGPNLAAWATAPNAAAADALSTAFMIMPPRQIRQYCQKHLNTAAMIVRTDPTKPQPTPQITRFGPWSRLTTTQT